MKKLITVFLAAILLASCESKECTISSTTDNKDTLIPITPWLCICEEFDYHSRPYRLSYQHDYIPYPTDLVLRLYVYDPSKVSDEEFKLIKDKDLVIYYGTNCTTSPTPYLVPLYTEKDNFDILYVGYNSAAIYTPINETK